MPKIIRISCSIKIFSKCPTVNVSKRNYWLVICIAKNFILTNLKVIFSIFRFFCTLRFQIYKYCPIITNHTSIQSLFITQFYKIDPYDWFCGSGLHIKLTTRELGSSKSTGGSSSIRMNSGLVSWGRTHEKHSMNTPMERFINWDKCNDEGTFGCLPLFCVD